MSKDTKGLSQLCSAHSYILSILRLNKYSEDLSQEDIEEIKEEVKYFLYNVENLTQRR